MKRARLQQSPIAAGKTATNQIPVKVILLRFFVKFSYLTISFSSRCLP